MKGAVPVVLLKFTVAPEAAVRVVPLSKVTVPLVILSLVSVRKNCVLSRLSKSSALDAVPVIVPVTAPINLVAVTVLFTIRSFSMLTSELKVAAGVTVIALESAVSIVGTNKLPLAVISPTTSNLVLGVIVPIPTLFADSSTNSVFVSKIASVLITRLPDESTLKFLGVFARTKAVVVI